MRLAQPKQQKKVAELVLPHEEIVIAARYVIGLRLPETLCVFVLLEVLLINEQMRDGGILAHASRRQERE